MSHGSSNAPTKRTIATQSLLADLTRVGYLPKVWLAPPEIQDLRTLVRHRAELTAQKRAKKLRVRALLRNPELRRVLIEAAQRLVRFDEGWQDFHQRMRERGKPYCVIAAAVANRWLRRM